MADNDKKRNDQRRLLNAIKGLDAATKASNRQTYGINTDPTEIITNSIDNYVDKISTEIDMDKALINSHMSRLRINNSKRSNKGASIYDLVNDNELMESVQALIGPENVKFSQLIKDYEVIKRCIPQIHKVVTSLCNNIMSPDAMAESPISISMPTSLDADEKKTVESIIEKYDINTKLKRIVMDYLIISVKYYTVVPYSNIPNMLAPDKPLSESIQIIQNTIPNPTTLLEASGYNSDDVLSESVFYTELEEVYKGNKISHSNIPEHLIKNTLSEIEFCDGALSYYKKSILNEAILRTSNNDKRSMKNAILKISTDDNNSARYNKSEYDTEGFVDINTIKQIQKKVQFKGAHIEELAAQRVIPFKLRDTIIGYFYVEDIKTGGLEQRTSISSVIDKINSTVYMKNESMTNARSVENKVIGAISEKLIKAINPDFIIDNYDDIDIIYEFVKRNELHMKKKRVVFFHPDDVCEFRRADGSIMMNCMFLAKLYVMTILSNVIGNVTRGSDRNIHYVKTGLTTDVEGEVNDAIRAIKQNQVRFSDVGSINEIFNIVGSGVDVFMPVSVDGDKPIETETISGQNIDMNTDFMNWLVKSIIMSFGVPAQAIDDFESVEFAKTVSMSNLDMAKSVLDAQVELNPQLTKFIRSLIKYDHPDFQQVDQIYATLNPPTTIVTEMNRVKSDAVNAMADILANFIYSPDANETAEAKRQRIFKYKYFKDFMGTIDWDNIDNIIKDAENYVGSETNKEKIRKKETEE